MSNYGLVIGGIRIDRFHHTLEVVNNITEERIANKIIQNVTAFVQNAQQKSGILDCWF